MNVLSNIATAIAYVLGDLTVALLFLFVAYIVSLGAALATSCAYEVFKFFKEEIDEVKRRKTKIRNVGSD